MKGSFFPEWWARENCNFLYYSAIAFRSFCELEKAYKLIYGDEDLLLGGSKQYIVYEKAAICETFSAFALESYLNMYAAACLGDQAFYDNYERLSALSKMQLISMFLYQEQINKDCELYGLLKHAFSKRDFHAHGKSTAIEIGMTKEAVEASIAYDNAHEDEFIQRALFSARQRLKDERTSALLSLRAVVGVACYIDAHDDTAFAKRRLLHHDPNIVICGSSFSEEMAALVVELVNHFNFA